MEIRLAQDKDYAEMARLHRGTVRHVNSKDYPNDVIAVWSKRTKAQRFRSSASKVKRWIAIENEIIIGFCDHDFECELGGLYIHKDYVNKGIGRRLLQTAEKSMQEEGCKKIKILSTITAKEFYQKHKYKVIKKDWHQIENKKVKVYVMEKNLT